MIASPLLIALLAAGSILFVVGALRAWRARTVLTPVATALGRNGNRLPDERKMKMQRPASERLLRPFLRKLYRTGRYLTPANTVAELQQNLIVAGMPGGLTVTDFLGLRVLAGAALGALLFTMTITGESAMMAMLYSLGGFIVGLYLPNFWLKSKMRARQDAIARALPDALDMMSICVDAGLGFEAALQKVAFQSKNELALEMRRVISEIRVGVTRSDALRHLAQRTQVPEVASFVGVLVQADKLGIAIRMVLRTQSSQMRVSRRQRAEEAAGKAPIKMMIPMVLFIFPALFVVILGPAIPRIMAAF
ncbi:MAG: type II secretion system F family protein [Litorilinea sp.]